MYADASDLRVDPPVRVDLVFAARLSGALLFRMQCGQGQGQGQAGIGSWGILGNVYALRA